MLSFLMIGQSNMAGRGFIGEVDPIKNKSIKILRNGRWRDMYVPVNADRSFSGLNLAESFADECAKKYGTEIGLIPCADGGTTLDEWAVHGLLYDHALFQTKLAMRTSTVAGILWHQGESDCPDNLYKDYEKKFRTIVKSFRKDSGLSDVPFIVGALGDYLNDNSTEYFKNYIYVNEALKKVASTEERMAFVSAEGLTSNPDNLHFNAASLRIFGVRYFNEFDKIKNDAVFANEKKTDTEETWIEKL